MLTKDIILCVLYLLLDRRDIILAFFSPHHMFYNPERKRWKTQFSPFWPKL